MEFCQSNLPQAACISMSVMTGLPALACFISSFLISRKSSFVFELKCKPEFEENVQLIERSFFKKMVKQVTSLLNCIVTLVFLTVYAQEPSTSIIILAFYSIQVALYIAFGFLLHAEHKRQGRNSNIMISNFVFNFLIQGAMGILFLFEHTLDTHCYALLIILQSVSFINLLTVIIMRNDFTVEAVQLQKVLFKTIRHKSTAITNNLLDNSGDQESMMYSKGQDEHEYAHSTSSTIKNLIDQSVDSKIIKESGNNSEQNSLKRKQSVNSRSESNEVREVINNRMTPSFSHLNKQSASNLDEEPKTYLYAYRDIKVIGYKAKDNSMQFVIQYFHGIKQKKCYRTHRDFKYLNQKMGLELANSSLFLPQLPKRIQKTGALDKKLLNDKVSKYNRFLNYIEFNKIESKEFSDFLLPNKDLQNYAPLSEKKEGDIESFISSCSPSDSIIQNSERDSIKISERPSVTAMPVSPSSFSRLRVQSEADIREKSTTIYLNTDDKENKANAENVKEVAPKQEIKVISEVVQPIIEKTITIAPVESVKPAKEVEEKEKEIKKQSTLSNSTIASTSSNRIRSSTASTSNNKLEEKRMILSSRRRQREEANEASFITQSEQQSLDSSYDNKERQASALSEGQETANLIEGNTKSFVSVTETKIGNRPSLLNSTSLIDSNSIRNSTNNGKHAGFSFSTKGQAEENIFFNMPTKLIQTNQLLIIIPQTKDMSGKTFYEIEFYHNEKKVHKTLSKRYNNFKEFHLTMKSELKKSNQVSILPDLPYKPSKSSMNLIEYRKVQLAEYIKKLNEVPAIADSAVFKNFIEWNY